MKTKPSGPVLYRPVLYSTVLPVMKYHVPTSFVSQVTFLITKDPSHTAAGRGRRKRSRVREYLSPDRFSLYSSLSAVSGGLTIFTTKADIHKVSAILEDNTAADKVDKLNQMD